MSLIHQSLRGLARAPGYACAVVGTMGVAIGACTAVFALVYGVLIRPLPFEVPERLVAIKEQSLTNELIDGDASSAIFRDWRDLNRTFDDITAFGPGRFVIDFDDVPLPLDGLMVYPNYNDVLGLQPAIGRGFAMDDAFEGEQGMRILISHRLWTDLWGADPGVVGKLTRLDGLPVEIIGVMPGGNTVPGHSADLWVPVGFTRPAEYWARYDRWLSVVGRLSPGVSLEQAAADLARIDTVLDRGEAARVYANTETTAVPLAEYVSGGARPALLAALGATALVLLLACTNVASLVLARGTTRARELAVRAALGADRLRLVNIVLTETLVLGAIGGALGVALAAVLQPVLLSLQPDLIPRAADSEVGPIVMVCGWVTAVITAGVFGLLPAFQAGRVDLQQMLSQDGQRHGGGQRSSRLRAALVAGQVALAVILLTAAGMLLHTLDALRAANPGFDSQGVVVARIFLDEKRYRDDSSIFNYQRQALERLRTLPGVSAAAAASTLPMDPTGNNYDLPVRTPGSESLAENELQQADYRIVTPDYFKVLGIPVLRGRSFDSMDHTEAPRVLIVNDTMARQLWAGQEAVGQRINTPAYDWEWFEIVGVVGDTSYYGLGSTPRPEMFTVLGQFATNDLSLVVRAEGGFEGLAASIRRALLEIDPAQPVYSVVPMSALVDDSIAIERFYGILLTTFALIALLVAAAGVYATLTYWVSQRRFELGIRMALGASRPALVGIVLRTGMLAVAGGLIIGLPVAIVTSQVVRKISPLVESLSADVLVVALLLLSLVAISACLFPALHASRLQPALVLKR